MIKEYLESLAAQNKTGHLPYKNKKLGITLKIISGGTMVLITAVFVIYLFGIGYGAGNRFLALVLYIVLYKIFSPIIGLWDYGASMLATTGEAVLAQESEGFVLFLRSQSDDPAHAMSNEVESQLVKLFGDSHHSLAIGKPDELFQGLGAPRIYLTEEEWKARAGEFLDRAKLVVIPMTKTKESLPEIEQVFKEDPTKLLFYLPVSSNYAYSDIEGYQQLTTAMAPWISKPFPPFPNEARKLLFITLNKDGEPDLLKPGPLYNFFEKLIDWSPTRLSRLDDIYLLSLTRDLRKKLKSEMHWSFASAYLLAVFRVAFSLGLLVVIIGFAFYILAAVIGIGR